MDTTLSPLTSFHTKQMLPICIISFTLAVYAYIQALDSLLNTLGDLFTVGLLFTVFYFQTLHYKVLI